MFMFTLSYHSDVQNLDWDLTPVKVGIIVTITTIISLNTK